MGEYYETIADVEASAEEADCVLGDVGYPPGLRYATAVVEDDPRLLTLLTNDHRSLV